MLNTFLSRKSAAKKICTHFHFIKRKKTHFFSSKTLLKLKVDMYQISPLEK
jgi:hypothetical protein